MAIGAEEERVLRDQLKLAIDGRQAHIDFDHAIADFPVEHAGAKPDGAPHSAWELLEHMRIAQRDILDFCREPAYKELKWPDEYWPKHTMPEEEGDWDHSVDAFRKDRADFEQLIRHSGNDLFGKLPNGNGQTLLREAMLIASHNSYHLGQLVFLRRTLENSGSVGTDWASKV